MGPVGRGTEAWENPQNVGPDGCGTEAWENPQNTTSDGGTAEAERVVGVVEFGCNGCAQAPNEVRTANRSPAEDREMKDRDWLVSFNMDILRVASACRKRVR